MANPQVENGYTRISNELLEALCHIRISGEANQILLTIFRKTYGFGKKEDAISLTQFSKATGLSRSAVCRALNSLQEMKLINREETGYITHYSINKNHEEWQVVSKKRLVSILTTNSLNIDNKLVSISRHTKERKKYTKEIVEQSSTEEFSFEEEVKKLRDSQRKDYKIIAHYWKSKGWKFENRDQFNANLKRELKAAKNLKGYTGEQIGRSITYCKKEYPDIWTLETVFKRIQDVISKQS